jgi:hypothetical protein
VSRCMKRGEESQVIFIYTASRSQEMVCHDQQQQQQQRLGYLPAPRPSICVVEGDGDDSTAHAGPFAAALNSHVPVACPSPLSKAATTVGWKSHIIIIAAEGSPVRHIQLYMQTLPSALRSVAA